MTQKPIYLDNNSTTRVDPDVLERMLPYFTEEYGNASSISHDFGRVAENAVATARKQVGELLNCQAKSVVFTSGATEANNLALLGVMRASKKGKHLIVNAAEHKAVLDPAEKLSRQGFEVTVLPVDEAGMVRAEEVENAIREDTILVSAMHANNEVGTLNAVDSIASICRKAGVLFHTDATQAVGKIPLDLSKSDVDLLSLSAHKIYGPKGVGALVIRTGSPRIQIEPLVEGGGHERKMRSGTLPVPLIVGLGAACAVAAENMASEADRCTKLREKLKQSLTDRVPGICFNGHPSERLPGNLHVSIPGANAEAVMMKLKNRLAISSGSACTMTSPEPSHVLKAMAISPDCLLTSLRFGIGRFNTAEEIGQAAELIAGAVEGCRSLSSYQPG